MNYNFRCEALTISKLLIMLFDDVVSDHSRMRHRNYRRLFFQCIRYQLKDIKLLIHLHCLVKYLI